MNKASKLQKKISKLSKKLQRIQDDCQHTNVMKSEYTDWVNLIRENCYLCMDCLKSWREQRL